MRFQDTKAARHREIITNEMQELINYRPHWIIRKGNTFFFLVLCMLISLTWFIRYPDIVRGSIKLSTLNKQSPSLQDSNLTIYKQELFHKQPSINQYYGQMIFSTSISEKIKPGQRVLVSVVGFPSNDFGYLTGIIDTIVYVPGIKDNLLIKVNFPKGLQTSYGKTISYKNDLSADADIITEDRKLFDRILKRIKDFAKK
jgi:hypothetical protein